MSDIQVKALLDIVNKKKAEIAALEVKSNWVTNCAFKYNVNNHDLINVQTANHNIQTRSTEEVIDILVFLLNLESNHNKACEILGLDTKFIYLGYTLDEWTTDLKTRLSRLSISTKKAELATLEKRLNNLMSADLKTQLELDEITKLLQ
jgi:hypothetical protein